MMIGEMTFSRWFADRWTRHGETKTDAIYRLVLATGSNHMTVRRALAGRPVSPTSAARLAGASEGLVHAADLVLPDPLNDEQGDASTPASPVEA